MPRISDQRRAERRDQILRATVRCIIRSGWQGLTMGDVVAESGLSAGAVYGYFAGKGDLLAAVAEERLGEVDAIVERFLVAAEPPGLPEVLEVVINAFREAAAHPDGDLTVVIVQIWGQAVLGGEVRDILRPRLVAVLERFSELIRRWQDVGVLPSDANPDHVARVFMAILPGYMLQRLVISDLSAAEFADGFRGLLASAT